MKMPTTVPGTKQVRHPIGRQMSTCVRRPRNAVQGASRCKDLYVKGKFLASCPAAQGIWCPQSAAPDSAISTDLSSWYILQFPFAVHNPRYLTLALVDTCNPKLTQSSLSPETAGACLSPISLPGSRDPWRFGSGWSQLELPPSL